MASAAAAAAGEVTDTECSICHELYTDPMLISCGHVLCRGCLLFWLRSQQDAACPLCRRPIVSPDTGQSSQSLDDIVDGFPTDVTMKIWVESEQLLLRDHACQSCVTQAATSLCLQCDDFLCTACTAMHGRLSSTRHHAVASLCSLTVEKLAASRTTPCQIHSSEACKLYCCTHGISICVLCASSKHKNCAEVKDLDDWAEETRAILTELVTWLSARETEVDRAIQELDDLLQETEKNAQAAAADISQTFDQIQATVQRRRREVQQATLEMFTGAKKTIVDVKAGLYAKRGPVTTHKAVAERGKGLAASGEMGGMAAAMKKRVADLDASPVATFGVDATALLAGVEKALAAVGQCNVTPAPLLAQPQPQPKLRPQWMSLASFLSRSQKQEEAFRFHDNCGKNITLTNNGRTAEWNRSGPRDGIVVSTQPMLPHSLYEVRLDDINQRNGSVLLTGVVTKDPGSLTLPDRANMWTSAVVFSDFCVHEHGTKMRTHVGRSLMDLQRRCHVGVMTDGDGRLHLYIDGQDQGEAGVQVSPPCFAFFDLSFTCRKFIENNSVFGISTVDFNTDSIKENSVVSSSDSVAFFNGVTHMLWYVVPPLLLALGTFGNVMTVVVMRGLRASQSTACLSVYFTALAVSDQCLLVSTVVFYWVDFVLTWPHSFFRYNILCMIQLFMTYTCSLTSAWFLVAMTYQRVTSVVAPHRVGVLCTVRRGKIIIATIVIVACMVNAHFTFSWSYQSEYGQCLTRDGFVYFMDIFTWIDLSLASAIPFLLLIVGNVVLIRQVNTSIQLSRSMRGNADHKTGSGTNSVYPMTMTLILTSAAFLVLSFPTCAFDLYDRANVDLDTLAADVQARVKLVETVALFLWMLVSASNFYLYLLSGSKFREETKRYLCQRYAGLPK
ncbi:hypothetical protein ACOMHN_012572 [Nucella lapillus]